MTILAQFDLVKPKYPKNDLRMDGFYNATDYVNKLAENHSGFIWRDLNESQKIIDQLFGIGHLYTLSLWKNTNEFKDFLYKAPHNEFRLKGREWFHSITEPHVVLWWVEDDHIPTLYEAYGRLELLKKIGPSKDAFTIRSSELFEISN